MRIALRTTVTDLPALSKSPPAAEAGGAAAARYPGYGKLFLIWTVIGVLTSLRFQFQRGPGLGVGEFAFTIAFTACYYPWIVLTPLVFRLEKRFPLGGQNLARNLGALALLSVPVCVVAAPLMSAFFQGVMTLLEPAWTIRWERFWWHHFPMSQIVYWSSVAGGYFFRSQFQLREQEQTAARLALEKSQLEAGLKQAQLDVIRARLNPHFLFNSLQNISVMTKQDPQTASRMLVRLGDLLRAVLRQDAEPETSLHDEVELTRAYVALEQMRFGERLVVTFDIAPDVQRAMVPCFLLQPLIENAVIHGLRGVRKTGAIKVSAGKESRDLILTVADNGIGAPEDALSGRKMGVGLGSTRERLAAMYPDRHAFAMRRLEEGGTEVRIAIPLRFAEDEDPFHDEQPAVADRR